MSFFRVQNELKMSRSWVLPEGVEVELMTLRRPNDLQNPLGEIFSSRSLAGGSLGEFGRVEILEIRIVYFTQRQETHKRFVNPGFGSWAPRLHRIRTVFAQHTITHRRKSDGQNTFVKIRIFGIFLVYILPKMHFNVF